MLFNSIDFLFFLPIVFCIYWLLSNHLHWQNLFLVIGSYIFYGWWDYRFLLLIALTSLCSYLCGIFIKSSNIKSKRKIFCGFNIIFNLAILAIFKYYNFFIDNINGLFNAFGYKLDWVTLNIILPVGISFYTFQALSYTIDVYQNKIKATNNIIQFFAFISFFPQLVAGPIERATNLLPQFQDNRYFDYSKAVDGVRQMLWGFFKKLVIADNCATIVNQYWDNYQNLPGVMLIILSVLFTFQIYCDFSGYSDIAIGCARLFGFRLMQNFNYPYFARSIPEFWRRWHISLTTWFRDYIYFPLGGSRCEKTKTIRNIFIVWSISGLWHGANWTFVLWGVFHATLLAIYNLTGISTKHSHSDTFGKQIPSLKEASQMLLTFFFAVLGWTIFRSTDISQAYYFIASIFTNPFIDGLIDGKKWIFICCMLQLIEWSQRDKPHALAFSQGGVFRYRIVRWCTYYIIIFCIINFSGTSQSFIYFKF